MRKPFISGFREALRNSPRRLSFWWWGMACLVLLSGCAALTGGPYKDALRRVGEIGPRIADDIKPDNPGEQARKDAFLDLCDECRRLSGE